MGTETWGRSLGHGTGSLAMGWGRDMWQGLGAWDGDRDMGQGLGLWNGDRDMRQECGAWGGDRDMWQGHRQRHGGWTWDMRSPHGVWGMWDMVRDTRRMQPLCEPAEPSLSPGDTPKLSLPPMLSPARRRAVVWALPAPGPCLRRGGRHAAERVQPGPAGQGGRHGADSAGRRVRCHLLPHAQALPRRQPHPPPRLHR